jgi:thiol:disulfide interchange protein DsbC
MRKVPVVRMKWLSLQALLLQVLLVIVAPAHAEDQGDAGEIAAIRALLAKTQAGMEINDVVLSPMGMYEVGIQNGQTIYVSRDAKYLIPGDLYEAQDDGLVNLGEARRNVWRRDRIAAIDEADMIVFAPEGERKATLTVFTDVDCPYCRKLHADIEALNDYGIAVRYLAFPRTGLNTEIHQKMIAIWCADDRKAMLTSAKRGADMPATENCDNPVADQYQLGREVGVTGTPALVLEDGRIMPGYVEAKLLAQYLLGEGQPEQAGKEAQ